tara:strand:- start:232 stop:924 length:693 start_codon:yes stop_codon:yes gene_type:complete
MLSLKQALSLVSIKSLGGSWTPADDPNLVAWYKKGVGITEDAGGGVSQWADSASNYDMKQADTAKQPAYNVANNELEFDNDNLQSTVQITITNEFTIAIRMSVDPAATNAAMLGDNTTSNNFFRVKEASIFDFKTNSSSLRAIPLNSADFGDSHTDYIVVTRDNTNKVSLWLNGTLQTADVISAGDVLIDCIGARRVDLNDFEGGIQEIQIYSTTSSDLTNSINGQISNI